MNAKTENCYFVWDDASDQFILVETLDELNEKKENYEVIYNYKDNYGRYKQKWKGKWKNEEKTSYPQYKYVFFNFYRNLL